jgi:Ser/Thr protein kinase RdoA (MazF antagonist)
MQPVAVLYSTLAAATVKRLVLPHYGLDDSVECSFFNKGLNDTYLVCANARKFALRLYRARWRTRAAVTGEVAALVHISAKGIPAAAPLARTDGEFITQLEAPEGPRCAVLFEWVSGDEPRYINEDHARLYGRLAAQLHIASDDVPPGITRRPLDRDYLLENPLACLRPALKSNPNAAERFDALAKRVRTRLMIAQEHLWDWGFCHGDLHGGNAHLENGRLSLYDFDCCGPGWRVYDLATYRWAARIRNVAEQAWKPYIEAYLQIRPGAANTLEHVPLFVLLRHIWLHGYHAWNSVEDGASYRGSHYAETFVTFCEKLESEQLG